MLLAGHDPRVHERGEDLVGALRERDLLLVGLRGVVDEAVHARGSVAALLDLGEDHRVGHAEARAELLRHRRLQALEGLGVPSHEALGRLGLLDFALLLGVAARLEERAGVLDVVLGRLGDDTPLGVEA